MIGENNMENKVEYIPKDWKIYKSKYTPRFYSVSGYGGKIPTCYTCNDGKIIRRVYAICYSNVASFYVRVRGERIFIQDYRLDEAIELDNG